MAKRVQVYIKTDDIEQLIKAECKKTGLSESQLVWMIINKYYYGDKK